MMVRVLAVLLCLVSVPLLAEGTGEESSVEFSRHIQPLLAKKCLLCHGPDEAEAGLRLDLSTRATAKLDSGSRAIVPGTPEESELLVRITSTDKDLRMPPEGEPLSPQDVKLLREWIQSGAKYETHWSYQTVKKPVLPVVKKRDWARNPIDLYLLSLLEERGVSPSPEAEKAKLMRRLYYDLIGLPPTPAEVQEFLQHDSPAAYEKLVDRLLASEHFGERWGRHWLDKARYADSDGYEKDRPRFQAWRYRDWVIDAFNRDLPFDQFTIEQLAGDLLPDADSMQKLATAFHRQTLTNTEGGTDQEQFRVEATFDRTETTAAVWMGLTMTCARCHTHKYDQITQREYYQLFAFFNNANEGNLQVNRSKAAAEEYQQKKIAHDQQLAELERRYREELKTLQPEIEKWIQDTRETLAENDSPLEFSPAQLLSANATSQAKLTGESDHSWLVMGEVPDKDEYTLVLAAPEAPLTGFKLEVLTHPSLGGKGPGRTAHGNFVLTHVRVYVSDTQDFKKFTPIDITAAEASFSQAKFSPESALNKDPKTGWAIAPQFSRDQQITFYLKQPMKLQEKKYLQVVLDQQYGSQHTIGRFRLSTLTGFDPLRSLPKAVANAVKTSPEQRTPVQEYELAKHWSSTHPATAKLLKELETLKKNAPKPPTMNVRVIVPAVRKTRLLTRGDFLQPGKDVPLGELDVIRSVHPLTPRKPDQPLDRLDLARWLVNENHPLTARVTVNQVWAHLFGRGLVPTQNDFGVRGEAPTHPQLLDWLAWSFPREMKWSRKTLVKTIVMSSTYRQSSRHRPDLQKLDPTNRLLARQNRYRVEAEIVRDLYLSVSGLLTKQTGGPSVFPPLPAGVAELSYANNFKWNTSKGDDRYRRGMYTFFKRTSPHPQLINFDCPDSNTSRLQRDSSNTPLQALATLNNEVFTEAAQAMARRVLTEGGSSDNERLTFALQLCIARQPSAEEVALFQRLLEISRKWYGEHPDDAAKLLTRHPMEQIAPAENAAWVATIRMIMNLDEFIVRD